MSRCPTLLLCIAIVIAGCSSPDRSRGTSPTAPSAGRPGSLVGPTAVAPGGISGKFDVNFPPRNLSFQFRTDLEGTYRTTLNRAVMPVYVDPEGEVVWTQEYLRYRVNGCSHETAVENVRLQVNGLPAAAVCGAPPNGLIEFPPRDQSFDFRRRLEIWYQGFNRGFSSSAVDPEGGVTWTQEYLRYSVNGCDHTTSTQKTILQVNGGPVTPTCFVPPCLFAVAPTTQSVPGTGGTFTAVVTRTQGTDCTFGAEALDSFVTITGGGSGSGETTTVTYTVAPNPGGPRSSAIRIRWTNNSTLLSINQAVGTGSAFVLTDPASAAGPVTTCLIRTAATSCTLTVNNPSSTATFSWAVSFNYGAPITLTGTGPSFTITQGCGGPGATPGGTVSVLEVTLTTNDTNGTTIVRAGLDGQPALTINFFTCS